MASNIATTANYWLVYLVTKLTRKQLFICLLNISVAELSTTNELAVQLRSQLTKSFHFLMKYVASVCKRLSQEVKDVNPQNNVIEILNDMKFWSTFDRYDQVLPAFT